MTLAELDNNTAEFLRVYDDAPQQVQDGLAFVFKLTRRILDAKRAADAADATITVTPRSYVETKRERKQDKAARLRDSIARALWEIGLKSELIDRAVNLWANGVVTAKEIELAIRKADDDKAAYDRTGRGAASKYVSFAATLKGWYDRAGWLWTPCEGATEPKPAPLPPPRAVSQQGDLVIM